ncbi:MAG: hypothetical protein SFU85_07490 [Candidatus Methylacidiphilales bacterium]|nr:hypothetical protein [Candidatus Methylacidiphilales bacterium]
MIHAERARLEADAARRENWKRWGPYLAERQWGTVREDYSADGNAWSSFPHEHARSRAYRWGEDGLLGWTDRQCRACFALALWNGKDPILKERLFGLSGPEGNHGEDVKECYHYLRGLPSHAYQSAVYKYPQAEFPYDQLREAGQKRSRQEPEFDLEHTGIFDEGRTFDIRIEYAKRTPDDTLIRITATNHGPESAPLHLLPTLWFRNSWSWGCEHEGCEIKPSLRLTGATRVEARHATLEDFHWHIEASAATGRPRWLFTENETNTTRLYGLPESTPLTKDAFHDAVIHGKKALCHTEPRGTKAAAWYTWELAPGESRTLTCRIVTTGREGGFEGLQDADDVFEIRRAECESFYDMVLPSTLGEDEQEVARQAYAGLLWSKQFYHYVVESWLKGDPAQPPPPPGHGTHRNADWPHFFARDVLSMPDKWEYPWFAAWDLAFHMIPFAEIDPDFAKGQLLLLLREWYMHPNGQIPAYEWNFGDVNPPVHAWAAWRVYKITGERGHRDLDFLERAFQKLLINFTWWVNRKDPQGHHIFDGGFLGLDNIGVFDRSKPLPGGGRLQQADATAWMGFYCLTMLSMALELAKTRPSYEDIASKFFEHFVAICDAINTLGDDGLWDEEDGFYYDRLKMNGSSIPMKIRSMVGLLPLCAVEILDEEAIHHLPGFRKRLEWFLKHRPELARHVEVKGGKRLLALASRRRLERLLPRLFDEAEFLSPHGLRSLSKAHSAQPFVFRHQGETMEVRYQPGESDSGLFGGNSNWRGPVWFPVNYLLIEALERYHHFYGDSLEVEFPTGSGNRIPLDGASQAIERKMASIFLPGPDGRRPCHAAHSPYVHNPAWKDLLLFHEYFHGDTGQGLGASHQTGWTALVTRCLKSGCGA